MLPRSSRLLFLLLLILLFAMPVLAAPDLKLTISHVGTAGTSNAHFLVSSTTGTIRVNLKNSGSATSGTTTLTIALGSGLSYAVGSVTSTPDGLFTTCTGTTTVTCATSTSVPHNANETITFPVT